MEHLLFLGLDSGRSGGQFLRAGLDNLLVHYGGGSFKVQLFTIIDRKFAWTVVKLRVSKSAKYNW